MEEKADRKGDAVDWYLAAEGEEAVRGDEASKASVTGIEAPREADAAAFARCDAVMALTPRLAESEELAWAFDEARRLARFEEPRTGKLRPGRWYLNPLTGWSTAVVLAVALLIVAIPRAPVDEPAPTVLEPPVPNFTYAPIVVTSDVAQTLAEIEPVVLLADLTPVDSRSLVVLPFDEVRNVVTTSSAGIPAGSLYEQVVRQLAAVPGVYLIDPATAAVYTNTPLSAAEIAQQLGVRAVVEGRIASVNGNVRFELRFTDAAANGISMNEEIERPREELARLRTDIAASVLNALMMVPSQDEFDAFAPLPLRPIGESR